MELGVRSGGEIPGSAERGSRWDGSILVVIYD